MVWQIASGSDDKTVKIWDLATGQCSATLSGHGNSVTAVAWSADGSRIASGSYDETVKIWDSATGQCLTTFNTGYVDYIQFKTLNLLDLSVGLFDLSPSTVYSVDYSQPLPQRLGYGFDESGNWVTYNGQCLLWLPPGYRPSISAVLGMAVVIGCQSGRFMILRFSNPSTSH